MLAINRCKNVCLTRLRSGVLPNGDRSLVDGRRDRAGRQPRIVRALFIDDFKQAFPKYATREFFIIILLLQNLQNENLSPNLNLVN